MTFLSAAAILTIALLSANCDATRFGQHSGQQGSFVKPRIIKKFKFQSKKIPCWKNVQYTVVNDCDWNSMTHPRDYPSSAHWSPLCGTTHNRGASVFKIGGISSNGVKQVAETGDCSTLQTEVSQCAKSGSCGNFLSYPCSAMDGTCQHTGTFDVTKKYPYLSLVSMAAPSPDWFVGVDSIGLCKHGFWVPKYEKYLMGNDAGTDGGPTFLSPDMPLAKRVPISVFDAKDDSNIFYNIEQGKLYPLCKITVTLKST
ncbi:hypothetical protein BSKO_02319 [Bryopsis sp. KO-2023]|nr:hypothetical protein BSKO_02319 [Bryopsis sp. KO-2023]